MEKYIMWLLGVLMIIMPILFIPQAQAFSWEKSSDLNAFIESAATTLESKDLNSLYTRVTDPYYERGALDKIWLKSETNRRLLRSFEYVRQTRDDSQVPIIPEPETYAMMLAGLGLLIITLRRQRGDQF